MIELAVIAMLLVANGVFAMAEIVQRNSDGVLVRADLSPGDAIITEGILQLSEGAEVTLLDGPDGTTSTADTATTR